MTNPHPIKFRLAAALATLCTAILLVLGAPNFRVHVDANIDIVLTQVGSYASGAFNQGGAEIGAYDPKSNRLFVVNGASRGIDVLDISNPAVPTLLFAIDLSTFGRGANSVAVKKGEVAVAVEATDKTDNGRVVFFSTDGQFLGQVKVGALPDMITYTPDGKTVLVANEGEPSGYGPGHVDPEGSVSLIDLTRGARSVRQTNVSTASFTGFTSATLDPNIRIFGPGATVAEDLEPEYIAVSHDSKLAWVTLQENNAIAILDIRNARFSQLVGLGFKDHSLSGQALDASDRDGAGNGPAVNIANWPVLGMYQPDAIASYRFQGQTYLVTANEGDARDWPGLTEEARISSLNLDPTAFPNAATLKSNSRLGRLGVTSSRGDTEGDGDFDQLFAFGARSFSIWGAGGQQVFDSGDQFEQITGQAFPLSFNSNNDANNSFDSRSDNKGPEPEGVAIGELFGRTYAFIVLERIGGIMVYEITDPFSPRFVEYVNPRDFSGNAAAGTAGDLGPEGVLFIPASDSPSHQPLLVVTNEVSGTTSIFQISRVD